MAPNLPHIRVSGIDILNDWDFENVKALGDNIPGYRSGATFLTTLRSNLHLSATGISPCNSLVSTPTSAAFASTALLAHPTPTHLSISPSPSIYYNIPEREPLPSVTNTVAPPEAVDTRDAALKLIADSISQQRLAAAQVLALHAVPLLLIAFITVLLTRMCSPRALLTAASVLIVIGLAALYWITLEYANLAGNINQDWLDNGKKPGGGKCEEPIVMVSRQDKEIIGALVIRVVKKERKGYVRAWTVKSSLRGKGIGAGLLHEGVKAAWAKGARSMVFEKAHANFHEIVPPMLYGNSKSHARRAEALLSDLFADYRREKSSR